MPIVIHLFVVVFFPGRRSRTVFSVTRRGTTTFEKLWIQFEGILSSIRAADVKMRYWHCTSLFQEILPVQFTDGLPSKGNIVSDWSLRPFLRSSLMTTSFRIFYWWFVDFRATCAYLACKTEEFNVSIGQFVSNIKGDKVKAMEIILSNELLLMQRLNYYLTIHNPYRPVEGFLIDIKTRCSLMNPDRLRAGIDEFLENTFFTEACLLFAPSQIALAAVLHAASKEQENLDNYVIESLFNNTRSKLKVLIAAVQRIRLMVKNVAIPEKEEFRRIEKKLDRCRNQDNNPASEALVFLLVTVPTLRVNRCPIDGNCPNWAYLHYFEFQVQNPNEKDAGRWGRFGFGHQLIKWPKFGQRIHVQHRLNT